MFTQVILGLGTNRSLEINGIELNPIQILNQAVQELSSFLINVKKSSIYKSRAMYYENQEDFFNMVVSGCYEGTPSELLDQIHGIEDKYGRNRDKEIRNGPRSLDIDIELFGEQIINSEDLEIPHKKIKERQFVLIPLLEILPNIAEPYSGTLYKDYLNKLPDQGVKLECKYGTNK